MNHRRSPSTVELIDILAIYIRQSEVSKKPGELYYLNFGNQNCKCGLNSHRKTDAQFHGVCR